jgi:hypothetical protein
MMIEFHQIVLGNDSWGVDGTNQKNYPPFVIRPNVGSEKTKEKDDDLLHTLNHVADRCGLPLCFQVIKGTVMKMS